MIHVSEIIDKTKRKISLDKKTWKHIIHEHPELSNQNHIEQIEATVKNPTKITSYSEDENIRYYYRYYKNRKSLAKYLLVIVKYLNGSGFIITAYFVKNIR